MRNGKRKLKEEKWHMEKEGKKKMGGQQNYSKVGKMWRGYHQPGCGD